MAKIKIYHIGEESDSWHEIQYHYMCPGCGYTHAVNPKVHQFNGSMDKPTFSPSLLQNWTPGKTCHSYIRDGKIQFLMDCHHALKGETVELPEIE